VTWQHSPEVDKIMTAFVAALSEVDAVTKTRTADMGSHKYTYADIGSVLDTIKPVLTKHQLGVSQPVDQDGVTTLIVHDSGQWLQFGPLSIKPTTNTPQATGSAITYARRYALVAAFNLATDDDDGAHASRQPVAHPNAARVDQLRADWRTMTDEQQEAGKAWAQEHGKTVTPAAMLKDERWLEQLEAWVDEQLNGT